MRATWSSAVGSHWRREILRTNLWVVPSLEVLGAAALFGCTLLLDRAAYRGTFAVPSWMISGSADAARQILTAIAAAVITVVGAVFSIILVTLTLASTQFGPRMLRNFIRDRGTQLTLGTFVATFVYAVLVLVSIGPGPRGDFVPHIGVTTTLGLMVADLAILIYFIHHTAVSIQLPLVIAGIARDLAGVDRDPRRRSSSSRRRAGKRAGGPRKSWPCWSPAARSTGTRERLRAVYPPDSLVTFAADAGAVISLSYRPGHFIVQGHPVATVWPPGAVAQVSEVLGRSHITGPYRTLSQDVSFGIDQLVEIAIRALGRGQ